MRMNLKFEWQRYGSLRKGGQLSISLLITCTRWYRSEKVAFKLIDGTGQIPPKDGYIELKAGEGVRIDFDTYDWDWCDGDTIIVFDNKGNESERHVLRMQSYPPGQCPECHGTHLCSMCKGKGRVMDKMHMLSTCPQCLGTGLCQTCYVPTRVMHQLNIPYGSSMATGINPNVEGSKERRIATLRRYIYDLQQKIERCEWEERMQQLRSSIHGTSSSSYTMQMSKLQLKFKYQQLLQNAQNELQQLEASNI